jgi:hypothetical protein
MQAKVKSKAATQKLAVTANRLRDGRVVWLAADGWSESVGAATILEGEGADAALARAQADEGRQIVVGPYLVEMDDRVSPMPLRMRERVRISGPTVLPVAAE